MLAEMLINIEQTKGSRRGLWLDHNPKRGEATIWPKLYAATSHPKKLASALSSI